MLGEISVAVLEELGPLSIESILANIQRMKTVYRVNERSLVQILRRTHGVERISIEPSLYFLDDGRRPVLPQRTLIRVHQVTQKIPPPKGGVEGENW
jgi:hypothetical protein